MTLEERESRIWDLLYDKLKNPYGVAAIMGNLMAESSLNPMSMTGKKASEYSPRNSYGDKIMNGEISGEDFSHDGIAFGLVQWLYWSRKKALYTYTRETNGDIRTIETQIGYLLQEMPKYKKVWPEVVDATDIQTPCDLIMLEYEKPAGTGEAAKQKRHDYAQKYFDKYYTEKVREAFIGAGKDMTIEEKVDILWKEHIENLL